VDQVQWSQRGAASVCKQVSITKQRFVVSGLCVYLLCLSACPAVRGQSPKTPPKDLTNTSIEDLMNIEVSSVSKKGQPISRTAAAVYVITQEDIRRSGMTSVPELMRMVPGMDVAQINANNWAVSMRGFNGRFANRLLVLIDGRSLYSPEFAGVFWQIQQLMPEDIERIEVIRGPGATLWGANAVNGVINIITKKAKDTQGGLASAGGGTQKRGFASVRYGASDGDRVTYRFYASYFNRGGYQNSLGQDAGDSWHGTFGGFRSDWQLSSRNALTIEGDVYNDPTRGQTKLPTFTPPFASTPLTTTTFIGGDVNSRWTHAYSSKSEVSLQMYYDGFSRDDILINAFINIFNIDFQERLAAGSRHDFVWGDEYRLTSDSTAASSIVSLDPPSLQTHLSSAFVQDEVALIPGRLWFTPGIRFEHVPFTGYNVEPSGRLLWSLSENQSLWISAAQTERTPQRSERNLHDVTAVFPGQGGSLTSVDLFGSPAAGDQSTLDFEAGYRAQVTKTLSADLATFYDRYGDLQTTEPGAPFFSSDRVPHTGIPLFYANGMHGKGYGGELFVGWKLTNRWKLDAGYGFLRQVLHLNLGSQSPSSLLTAGDNPQHQFQIRSQLNLPRRTEFDTSIYYVGRLLDQSIPAYTRLDLRVGWHPGESVDLDVIGQNLLSPRRLEFLNNTGIVPTFDPRRVFARLTWRFSH
jgi:iron complex outermembrane receptor protein